MNLPKNTGVSISISAPTTRLPRYGGHPSSQEFRLLLILTVSFVVVLAGSILLAATAGPDPFPIETKGWLERVGSALLVSSFTSVLTLLIQYRRWRQLKIFVEWA